MQELIEQAFSEAHKECKEKKTCHHAELLAVIKTQLLATITGLVLDNIQHETPELAFIDCYSEGFHTGYRLRQLEERQEYEVNELKKIASK